MSTETKTVPVPSALIAMLIVVVCTVPLTFLRGWSLGIVWYWFAPVIDPRIPLLTTWQMIALCALIASLTPFRKADKEQREKPAMALAAEAVGYGIASPFIILFCAFIIHLFVHV